MGYGSYSNNSQEQGTTFNAELFHRQMTLECLAEYTRFKQTNDFDNMFALLESITDLNSAIITTSKKDEKTGKTTGLDPALRWLRHNKDKWCIKNEDGIIDRINPENKLKLEIAFQKTLRMLIKELTDHGIIHKVKDDPRNAMAKFD